MKNLRRLGAAVVLTFVLGLSTFAGEVETPPCAPPVPGEVETPPCASVPRSETTIPSASNPGTEFSATEAAINILQSVLSLF